MKTITDVAVRKYVLTLDSVATGKRMRLARKNRRLSLRTVGTILNYAFQHLAAMERGTRACPEHVIKKFNRRILRVKS